MAHKTGIEILDKEEIDGLLSVAYSDGELLDNIIDTLESSKVTGVYGNIMCLVPEQDVYIIINELKRLKKYDIEKFSNT